jgi:hypothetical protein
LAYREELPQSKHDQQAPPVHHHKRESIDVHLTIVSAALAISHWIEHRTGWSIKKFVRTAAATAPSSPTRGNDDPRDCRKEPLANNIRDQHR